MVEIRRAQETDFEQIWEIIRSVAETGDTYIFPPDVSRNDAKTTWMTPLIATYVALQDGGIVGTYILKPNQTGRGSHVANASYMVHPAFRRRGVGRAMGEHSLAEARSRGYLAMQFNMVVSTNEPAISLWKDLGFTIVGTLPKAFRHGTLGLVDAHVMYHLL